jgi:hypothetical protein
MLLFGDPAMIEQMTGRHPSPARAGADFWRGLGLGGHVGEEAPPAEGEAAAPLQLAPAQAATTPE